MEKISVLSKNLIKRGFETEIFPSGNLASKWVYETVKGSTVGLGSSMTLKTMGISDAITDYAKEVYFHTPGQGGDSERKALHADFFLTSANAISMDGHIVNIDGTGNRVAATCFGPKNIIIIVGKNKIEETLKDALERAKSTAVKMAKYYNLKTPCVITGKCEECLSPECICSITVIHRKKPMGINSTLILVNEELGV